MKEGSKRVEEEEGRRWREGGREGKTKKGKKIVATNNCRAVGKKMERSAEVCALQALFLFLALISIKWASS